MSVPVEAAARDHQTRSFYRRQLVLAGLAGAVVLVALVVVVVALDNGREAAHALRPAADGSGVRVAPVTDSFRSATWAVVVALVAVAALLTVLLTHMVRVARFAMLDRPGGRGPREEAAAGAAWEDA